MDERKVSVVIPNYNGAKFIKPCLKSLKAQKFQDFEVILVDNGSTDGSVRMAEEAFEGIRILRYEKNQGFCKAVNDGVKAAKGAYVLLLNNDVVAEEGVIGALYTFMVRHPGCFSCQALLRQMDKPELTDDAGDFYCALGWAFARGKDQPAANYQEQRKIFAACAGAAIYRKAMFDKTGYFDEEHFAYLEDIDLGYRARICGYENWYEPKAVVFHAGSGTTGSRYNAFKVRYAARNSIYLVYKNMPWLQILLNAPFLFAGILIKWLYFVRKGFGREYAKGIFQGIGLCKRNKKNPFKIQNIGKYLKIQGELWMNILRRTGEF